ncbi:MAG: GAF domain-containing sensor histidine kinase [Anaerolineae bacterium]|nr:GAF domain-containing sensor histidine kinase [Anaerolineae bacterium]
MATAPLIDNPQHALKQLQQQVMFLNRMVAISRLLNSTVDFNHLLQLIMDTATEILEAEASSILLVDEHTGDLFFVASSGTPQEELSQIKVPMEGSIAGTIVKSGEPLIVGDVSQDSRHYAGVDDSLGSFHTQSILGVPLNLRTHCIGVLEVLNKCNGEPFNQGDVEILLSLASQAAVAIENARLIRSLRDANRRLAELDSLKSNFISIVSHELRTPLMVVLGYAGFLREHSAPSATGEIDMVLKGARQLQSIIDQITNLEYLEHGLGDQERVCFKLQDLIDEVSEQWRPLADGKRQTLRKNFPARPITVCVDRSQIGLALSNLLNNAVTFTPEEGQLEVSIRPHTGMVAVSVVDTGIGIAKEKLERIFDRFYQVEDHLTRHHEGLGVGLSVAKEIVELHGGRIWAESVVGRGSRFTFMLPIRWDDAVADVKREDVR